jgi:hypothetical protein
MNINLANEKTRAESLFHTIYPRSTFMNRDCWHRRQWIDGVEAFRKAILEDVLERYQADGL